MKLSSLYNKINELLRHLFKQFPILLGVIVSDLSSQKARIMNAITASTNALKNGI